MKLYTVHRRPEARPEDHLLVKDGFSWPAFFVPVVWLIIKRMWLALAAYLLALAVFLFAAAIFDLGGREISLIVLAMSAILGFEGNDLRRRSLASRGFLEIGLAAGRDLDEAEHRFFSRALASRPDPAAPSAAGPRPVGDHA